MPISPLRLFIVLSLTFLQAPVAPAQSSRPFQLVSSAVQSRPGEAIPYQNFPPGFTPQAIAADADIVTVFPEYLGIPFEAFGESALPAAGHPWTVQMKNLAATAKQSGKPLMVQLVLTRDRMAPRAVSRNGSLEVQPGWAPGCFDFSAPQNAYVGNTYVNYARWISSQFSARYLVIMVEMNLYYVSCGGDTASWQALVEIERRTYDAVKAARPLVIAFPSFKLEDIYGQTLTGFDQTGWAALSRLKRDRLGLATYPFGVRNSAGYFVNPYELPSDYLTRVRTRNPSEPRVVITETGWNTDSLAIGTPAACYAEFLYSHASFAAAYMELLLYSAHVGNFDAVAWWSARDLIDATAMTACYPASTLPNEPECNGSQWCRAINAARRDNNGWPPAFSEVVFKAFGTMGFRRYDGAAKTTLYDRWSREKALPIRP